MKLKSIVFGMMFISVLFLMSLSCYAYDALATVTVDRTYGKVFINGENEVVDSVSDFDTYITQLEFVFSNDKYYVSFNLDSEVYEISADMVSAKWNNANGDHYVLAPDEETVGGYDIDNISYALCANEHDLLPVNYDNMTGKPVITIILSKGNDVYYWQSNIELKNAVNSAVTTPINIKSDANSIERANEFYFISNQEPVDFVITSDEVMDVSEINPVYFTENISSTVSNDIVIPASTDSLSDNPYKDDGVPNSIFQTVDGTWGWRQVGINSQGYYYPWRYYYQSYEKYGSNNIYTTILFLEITEVMPLTYTPVLINGTTYNSSEATFQMKIVKTPHTVVYYPDEDVYDFMLGGENLVKIDHPAIEAKKSSSGVEHFIYGRANYAKGTKYDWVTTGITALANISVKLLDMVTYDIASQVWDILSLVPEAVFEIGENDGVSCELYSSYKMGSIESELDGTLHRAGDFYGMKCLYAAATSAGDDVLDVDWQIHITVEYK